MKEKTKIISLTVTQGMFNKLKKLVEKEAHISIQSALRYMIAQYIIKSNKTK